MARILTVTLFSFIVITTINAQNTNTSIFNTPVGLGNDDVSAQPKKATVLALTVLLGPIGGHRVLLGTKTIVPVLYTLTLGGGLGLVPLIDFFVCLFKKDLTPYKDEDRFLMWLRKPEGPTTLQ